MKKLIYSALALIGLLAASCAKEQELPVVTPEKAVGTHTVSIKATIADGTRTSYVNDKTFNWKAGDIIEVMTVNETEGTLRLADFTAQSDGPEVIFSGEVEDGYVLAGNAFYTAYNSYISGEVVDDQLKIYMNMPTWTVIDGDKETQFVAESANPLSNLPLVGFKADDSDAYEFQTASGAVKFTMQDVPEGASIFIVEGSSNYLSGQFGFDEHGVLTMENHRTGSYDATGDDGQTYTRYYSSRYIIYSFERNEDGTATIYMPLPVGEIPAGAVVEFYSADEDGNIGDLLYSRSLRAAIPIERNRVTEVASFSCGHEWESMGYGYFYDLPVFYYMCSEEDRENDDMVYRMAAVEFFKDNNTPGLYRIENPFKVAAEYRGYTIDSEFEVPDYLTLTVLRDHTVIYPDIETGYLNASSDGSRSGQVYILCPGAYMDDNSFNFVPKYQEDGTPQEIILSGIYVYTDSYYYWMNSESIHYMWTTIIFPGVEEQVDLACSVDLTGMADNTPAQPKGNVEVALNSTTDIVALDLVIARTREEAEQMIADGQAVRVTEADTYVVNFPANAPAGSYFAFAKNVPAEGFTSASALLFQSEDEYEYFPSDMDRELTDDDIVGTYAASNYYYVNYPTATGWTSAPKSLSLVVEPSDDPFSGEIMFTDICPEIAKAVAGRQKATPSPVYAWFDYATGVVTIPAGQEAYKIGSVSLTIGNFYGEDASLYLKESGVLYCKNNIAFFVDGSSAAWTNTETTYTRSGSNAPAYSYGFGAESVATDFIFAEPSASMPKHLQQSVTPLPFLGFEGMFRK